VITITTISDAIEGGSDGRFQVSSSVIVTQDTVIDYIVSGTATQFVPLSGQVTMLAGHTRVYFDVVPTMYESGKTVSVTLINGTNYTVSKPSSATVKVIGIVKLQRDAMCRAVKRLKRALQGSCEYINGYLCSGGVELPIIVNGVPIYSNDVDAKQAVIDAAANNQTIAPGVADQLRWATIAITHWRIATKPGYRNDSIEKDYDDAVGWLKDVSTGKVCLIIDTTKKSSGSAVNNICPVFTNKAFKPTFKPTW
jgi:hypothetical protein